MLRTVDLEIIGRSAAYQQAFRALAAARGMADSAATLAAEGLDRDKLRRRGVLVTLAAILGGELDKYPEAAFSNVGNVDEVIEKAKKMGAV